MQELDMQELDDTVIGVLICGNFLDSVSLEQCESSELYCKYIKPKPQTLFKGMTVEDVETVTGDGCYHYGELNKKVLFESLLRHRSN